MRARLVSAISTAESETELEIMELRVHQYLLVANTLSCPIETMYASSDGTVLCIAGYVRGSMSQELISAETTGLSSTKSAVVAESSIMMVV